MATSEPIAVSRRGFCPCLSHIQPTTSTSPRYSSKSATPIDSVCTALKKNTWPPATAIRP
jgi:hypothetical protein